MKIIVFNTLGGLKQEILHLPQATTLGQALAQCSLVKNLNEPYGVAVWGKLKPPHTVLNEGDRIELLGPLKLEPKEARRLRARHSLQARASKKKNS